jgi:hypothetical protein
VAFHQRTAVVAIQMGYLRFSYFSFFDHGFKQVLK